MDRHAYKRCPRISRWPLIRVHIHADKARYERGLKLYGRPHHGIDISADFGAPVTVHYRSATGWSLARVTKAIYVNGYGNSASFCIGPVTVYIGHLAKLPRIGDGYIILGSTGNSTGPHIHCEVFFLERLINPVHLVLFSYGKRQAKLVL